jgi:hypothetical protein
MKGHKMGESIWKSLYLIRAKYPKYVENSYTGQYKNK